MDTILILTGLYVAYYLVKAVVRSDDFRAMKGEEEINTRSDNRPWETNNTETTQYQSASYSYEDEPFAAYKAIFRTFYYISESDGKIDQREEKVLDTFIAIQCVNSFQDNVFDDRDDMRNRLYALLMDLKKEAAVQTHRQLGPELNIIYSEFDGNVGSVYKLFVDCITADLVLDSKELNCMEIIDQSFKINQSSSLSEIRDAAIFALSVDQIELYYIWYMQILKRTGEYDPKKYINNQYIKWKSLEQSNDSIERTKSLKLQEVILKLRKGI
ncbi:MAG: hypothetical protein HN564_05935 [Flavobacteriales bacterium]|jgi:hypothetical protein|nr:hypothetical protein [Gammaproteobacteria bacterium]MBT7896519.1 hypothetical protein [Flavobacteriales bacterium]